MALRQVLLPVENEIIEVFLYGAIDCRLLALEKRAATRSWTY